MKISFWKIARLVIKAVRAAIDESESAQEPDSSGGRRITPSEAYDIAQSVLSSLVEPLADLLTTND